MVKLRSEQMRSEEIRSEHGARSTEIHGCYRRLLLTKVLTFCFRTDLFTSSAMFVLIASC